MPDWFAPKRYGFGSGRPVSWQGWLATILFIAALIATGYFLHGKPAAQAAIAIPLILGFCILSIRTTRGGWRWHWGGDE